MTKRRKKPLGTATNNFHELAQEFLSSAQQNFNRIRARHSRADYVA